MTYPNPNVPGQPPQPPYPQQQQWEPPPAVPTPKAKRKWPWIVGGIVALLVIGGLTSGSKQAPTASTPGVSAVPSLGASSSNTANVTYEIAGGGRASNITYSSDGSGSIAQEAGVKLPWRKEITVEHGFKITTVSAQNAGSGQITCRILVDGQVVKQATSSGQYSIVSCTSDPL